MIIELQPGEMVMNKHKLAFDEGWQEMYDFVERQWVPCLRWGRLSYPLFFVYRLDELGRLAPPRALLTPLDWNTPEMMGFFFEGNRTFGAIRRLENA